MKHNPTSGKKAALPNTQSSSPCERTRNVQQQQLVFDKLTQPPLPTAAIAEPYVTKATVTAHFGMSLATINRNMRDGMPFHHVGKRLVRFHITEIQRWLAGNGRDRFLAQGRANTLAEARKRLVVIPILEGLELLSATKKTSSPQAAPSQPQGTPKCKPGRKPTHAKTPCDAGRHRWRTSQYTRTCVDCGRTEERDATNNWVLST